MDAHAGNPLLNPLPFTTLIRVPELLAAQSAVLVDCRFALRDPVWGRAAYAAGHLPGAHYLDLDTELSGPRNGHNGRHPLPDPQQLAARLGSLGITAATQVVAYDDAGGMFAARLWWLMRWLGHRAVAVLDGGLQAWSAHAQALTTELPTPAPQTFPLNLQPTLRMDAAQLLQQLPDPAQCLIDARSADRFRGENETLDPVGGHIPGAINRPFQDNLGADGCFKPASLLQEDFGALIKGGDAHHVVHQCGSGVTACHNLLAMETAGLSGSRLYAGSWSEWCSDNTRPMIRGQV